MGDSKLQGIGTLEFIEENMVEIGTDSENSSSGEAAENPHNNDDSRLKCVKCIPISREFSEKISSIKSTRTFTILWLIIRLLAFVGFLYLFVCALSLMSDAFRLMAGRNLANVFRNNPLLQNPVVDLMIGVLVTMAIHSSSTTTAIMISMASSGSIGVDQAIYVVFGAEIGTSVTSTLVAVAHMGNRQNFRKAFSGATIQSVYNWLSILLFFPLEVGTHCLRRAAEAIIGGVNIEGGAAATEFLNRIIKPVTTKIIRLDKNLLTASINANTSSNQSSNITSFIHHSKGDFLFAGTHISDEMVGLIVLAIALVTVFISLTGIAKSMHSLFAHQFSDVIKKYINTDLPGRWKPLTGYLFILIGAGMTFIIQSSTIFTSTLTPMVAVGLISVDRVFPLILGANIGTTGDSVLAALAQDPQVVRVALTVALVQVLFNVVGVLVFYPIPFTRRLVIDTGKWLGKRTCQYRWFALVYIVGLFVLLPLFTIGLSVIGPIAFYAVLGPLGLLVLIVAVVNALQSQTPHVLPHGLRDWSFLPMWMRSLEPYDRWMRRRLGWCRRYKCCGSEVENEEEVAEEEEVGLRESEEGGKDDQGSKDTGGCSGQEKKGEGKYEYVCTV